MSYKIITVNREFESAGSEIAQAVAAKLDIPYYDRFLITAAADESGINEERLAAVDEKAATRFEYSHAEAAYYYTHADNPLPTSARLAEIQFQLIRKLADQGPCLIVGRCANYVLRERDDVLDVFIHAGHDARLRRTMESLDLPERKAERVLKQTDKARKTYYKNYTGRDWDHPDLYHMVLNSDRVGFDRCVDLICEMYRL